MNPWTAGVKYRVENRLNNMAKIIKEGGGDLVLAVEGHVTLSAAPDIQAWARIEKCEAVVAPTSTTAAAALDEHGETGARDPAAGIEAVMSRELNERLRGRPERSISGRLLHLTFGDGPSPEADNRKIHVIACYGLFGAMTKNGARADMARRLAVELTEILSREECSDDNSMVYADINTVGDSADRASGATLTYDHAGHALWRVLNEA